MRKSRKKVWLFILIPILVIAAAGGGAYFYLQTKLKARGTSTETKVVNAMIKEMVTHPAEIKKMMNTITVADGDAGTSSDGKGTSAKSTTTPSSSSAVNPDKSKTALDSSSVSSFAYMKSHYTEYELLSTSAKNLGGNTYLLTATVRHKPTGKVCTVQVTTQLSKSMKETLRNYKK